MAQADLQFDPEKLNRVIVVGTSCSGKTTFARQLADELGSKHIELDALHWLPDWQGREQGEFFALVDQATSQGRWVLDGNYSAVRGLVWPRATMVIWLNYPFTTVFRQALSRTIRRSLNGEVLWSGNRESLQRSFFRRDSILLWVLQTYHRRRRQYRQVFDASPAPEFLRIELKNHQQTRQFLERVGLSDH